jgi:hypothetical protein
VIELIEGFAFPERFDYGGHGSSINIKVVKRPPV